MSKPVANGTIATLISFKASATGRSSAGACSLLSLILAVGIVWQSTRSRYIPYVVEVDKLGYALTVPKPLIPSTEPALIERMERYEVATFIRDSRTVSSDPGAEQHMLNDLLAHAQGAADKFLDDYFHSDNFSTIRSRWPSTRRCRCRSIPSWNSRHTATRCDGASRRTT